MWLRVTTAMISYKRRAAEYSTSPISEVRVLAIAAALRSVLNSRIGPYVLGAEYQISTRCKVECQPCEDTGECRGLRGQYGEMFQQTDGNDIVDESA